MLFFPVLIAAQTIRVSPFNKVKSLYLSNYPEFNAGFIKRNKIKSVHIDADYKTDGKVIVDTKNRENYGFDSLGRLIFQQQIAYVAALGIMDTVTASFIYKDSSTVLLRSEKRHKLDRFSHEYEYHGDTLVKHQYLTYSPEHQKELLVYTETFESGWGGGVFFRKTKNDLGKAYQEEKWTYQNKDLIEYSEALLFNQSGYKLKYTYDPYGRIVEAEHASTGLSADQAGSGTAEARTQYTYDNLNLIGEQGWRKGVLSYKKEFIYNEAQLLTAILWREEEIKTIKILKVTYEFW